MFSLKELNIRQQGWVEFLKDYNFDLQYHPGKANVAAGTLSRRSIGLMMSLMISVWPLIERLRDLYLDLRASSISVIMVSLRI